jgi:hypothetical protein
MNHRYLFGAAAVTTALLGLAVACSESSSSSSSSSGGAAPTPDAQGGVADAGFIPEDPPGDPPDAGKDAAKDAAKDTGAPKDGSADSATNTDAGSLAPCTFNRECPSTERCECNNGDCACRVGARGTGQNGVTSCEAGNDCESSLCVEGQGGAYYCSGECDAAADCKSKLPVCSNIAFIGKICVRQS